MLPHKEKSHTHSIQKTTGWITVVALLLCLSTVAAAQNFSSGSTGADGAFAPTSDTTLQIPESGIFNYTTVNIPSNVTVKYKRNSKNTPVTILATGNIVINGAIDIQGTTGFPLVGGPGGPGGFDGGRGGYGIGEDLQGQNGGGPGGGGGGRYINNSTFGYGGGGGNATAGQDGTQQGIEGGGKGGGSYGSATLLPLIGGSGGGGGSTTPGGRGGGGGGGGGAILIATSTGLSGSGVIYAQGGSGSAINTYGGGGAGGAIRLVANTMSGTLNLQVGGGTVGGGLGYGGQGYVRVEAFDVTNFNPQGIDPKAIFTVATPKPAILASTPTLRITKVAGIDSPAIPSGSFQKPPDIIVPTSQTNPVTVNLDAAHIPLGTVVKVTMTPETGTPTNVQSTALAGTVAASTATASISLPATGMSIVSATTTIDLTIAKAEPLFIDGEQINRVEIAATFGGASNVTYISASGKRIKKSGE